MPIRIGRLQKKCRVIRVFGREARQRPVLHQEGPAVRPDMWHCYGPPVLASDRECAGSVCVGHRGTRRCAGQRQRVDPGKWTRGGSPTASTT